MGRGQRLRVQCSISFATAKAVISNSNQTTQQVTGGKRLTIWNCNSFSFRFLNIYRDFSPLLSLPMGNWRPTLEFSLEAIPHILPHL